MRARALVALILLGVGCRGDGTGPGARRITVESFGPTLHYAAPSSTMADLLGARVTDASTGRAVNDVQVDWRVVGGNGTFVASSTRTDEFGVARARLALGAGQGPLVVEADAGGRTGPAPRFTIHVAERPEITSITPPQAAAGDTVTIRGRNFGTGPDARFVAFDGVRGRITAASDTLLSVQVPQCVRTGGVSVVAGVGGSVGNGVPFQASAPAGAAPDFEIGVPRTLTGDQFGCIRLPAPPGAEYLFITQNVHRAALPGTPFELRVHLEASEPVIIAQEQRAERLTLPAGREDWEMRLRRHEAQWAGAMLAATQPAAALPTIGERRQFNVLKADLSFERVTAEVRHVSDHAIIYYDLAAPAPRLSDADFASLAAQFDDPIHPTSVSVFGEPSDIDGNGRALILFTPQVNALTRPSDPGFIAGFFYGCDLLERSRCSGTNSAEIFYAMVPDDAAIFGKRRTRDEVMRTLPGVLAHEYQHMIHFAQRGLSLDMLWLSEGLAHAAEDVVARVLQEQGRSTEAADMRRANSERAREYVRATSQTSLIGETSPGSLAMRGGVWLLLEYLAGLYGGDDLLRQLTQTQSSGIANLEQRIGESWDGLLSDFAIALVAEGRGWSLGERWTFSRISLQSRTAGDRVPIALYSPGGALDATALPASSMAYGGLIVPLTGLTFPDRTAAASFTGVRGGPFDSVVTPRLVVLRLR